MMRLQAVKANQSDKDCLSIPVTSLPSTSSETCEGSDMPGTSAECTLSTATTTKAFRPWPTKFTFPLYALRAGVLQKLQTSEKLSRGDRSHVTDAIYHEVTKYTYYPKEWQYTVVVTAFLEKFPKVTVDEGTSMNLWRQRVQYRFQNDRRRRDMNCIPGKRRLSDPSKEERLAPKKVHKLMWGLQNYLTDRPEGEDEISISRHKATMKAELSKRKPDQGRLDRMMSLTFADRRNFVVKQNPLVAEIKEEYPVLFASGNEVLKEFQRIATEGLGRKLETGLQKYHGKLFTLAKKQDHSVVKKLVELASLETAEENRQSES